MGSTMKAMAFNTHVPTFIVNKFNPCFSYNSRVNPTIQETFSQKKDSSGLYVWMVLKKH